MKWVALLLAGSLMTACVRAVSPVDPLTAASTERPAADGEWSNRTIQHDVESSVRERFGDSAFNRALAADASVMSKLYHGMPYPAVQQPDGSWKDRPKPVALVIREHGQWLRARGSGFTPVAPAEQKELSVLIGGLPSWNEPARIPQGGCTDGGSSLFVIRVARRDPQVRQGTCGGPPLLSRLSTAVY